MTSRRRKEQPVSCRPNPSAERRCGVGFQARLPSLNTSTKQPGGITNETGFMYVPASAKVRSPKRVRLSHAHGCESKRSLNVWRIQCVRHAAPSAAYNQTLGQGCCMTLCSAQAESED